MAKHFLTLCHLAGTASLNLKGDFLVRPHASRSQLAPPPRIFFPHANIADELLYDISEEAPKQECIRA
jgi:hypothetical protein